MTEQKKAPIKKSHMAGVRTFPSFTAAVAHVTRELEHQHQAAAAKPARRGGR